MKRYRVPTPEPVFVVDTREVDRHGCAWEFDGIRCVRKKLDAADYSFLGGETTCAIERKTLPDWIASMTRERARYIRSLERLSKFARKLILVEGDWSDVMTGNYRSATLPQSLIGGRAAIEARYQIPHEFLGNRRDAQAFAATWLRWCWSGAQVSPFRSRLRPRGWRAAA